MKPIDPFAQTDWVHPSEEDAPPEEQSRWKLRVPTLRERRHIQNASAYVRAGTTESETVMDIRTGDVDYYRVLFGLAGVENFPGWETTEHPLDKTLPQVPTDGFLTTIPQAVYSDLSSKLAELSTMEPKDAGESSPPSTSPSTPSASE